MMPDWLSAGTTVLLISVLAIKLIAPFRRWQSCRACGVDKCPGYKIDCARADDEHYECP